MSNPGGRYDSLDHTEPNLASLAHDCVLSLEIILSDHGFIHWSAFKGV